MTSMSVVIYLSYITQKFSLFSLNEEYTCQQEIIIAVRLILDVKAVKYQYDFSLCWRSDYIFSELVVPVLGRIVWRNNGVNNFCENLHV